MRRQTDVETSPKLLAEFLLEYPADFCHFSFSGGPQGRSQLLCQGLHVFARCLRRGFLKATDGFQWVEEKCRFFMSL